MGEMFEGKRLEFCSILKKGLGLNEKEANQSIDRVIDTFVYYAGFCDKYSSVMGSSNAINSSYTSATEPEALGVVAVIESDKFCLERLIDGICSPLVTGNGVVVVLGKGCPSILAPLAEVFATSDLPKGVVNLLTGRIDSLHKVIGGHHEVDGVYYLHENEDFLHSIKVLGSTHLKRVHHSLPTQSIEPIVAFTEFKTVWQPSELR